MAAKNVKVEPVDLVVPAGAWDPATPLAPIGRDGRVWNEEFA